MAVIDKNYTYIRPKNNLEQNSTYKPLAADPTNTNKARLITLSRKSKAESGIDDSTHKSLYLTGVCFAPMLFQWCYSHMAHFSSRICCDFFTARFFRSRPLFIARFLFCRAIFHVQTGWALLFVLQLIVLLFVFQ